MPDPRLIDRPRLQIAEVRAGPVRPAAIELDPRAGMLRVDLDPGADHGPGYVCGSEGLGCELALEADGTLYGLLLSIDIVDTVVGSLTDWIAHARRRAHAGEVVMASYFRCAILPTYVWRALPEQVLVFSYLAALHDEIRPTPAAPLDYVLVGAGVIAAVTRERTLAVIAVDLPAPTSA